MAAITLGDMKSFLADRNSEDPSARAVRDYVRIANSAAAQLRRRRDWAFDRRVCTLNFLAPISVGTVDVAVGAGSFDLSDPVLVAAMVGCAIRFNNEPQFYLIGHREDNNIGDLTQVGGQAATYRGLVDLIDKPYQIFCPRAQLPADFRTLEQPQIEAGWWYTQPLDIAELIRRHTMYPAFFQPTNHAIEDVSIAWDAEEEDFVTVAPQKWLWVYPGPSPAQTVVFPYMIWAPTAADDADTFGLPDVPIMPAILQAYALALLSQQQGQASEYQNQLVIADKMADEGLASFVEVPQAGERRMWNQEGGQIVVPWQNLLAPGSAPNT